MCLSYLERIPACGGLLASLDADAFAWVREGIPIPERSMLDAIFKGKTKLINFDVASTRYLVIRIQAVLLAVPLTSRDDEWMDRKGKCDGLLALCTSLSQNNVQQMVKGSGLLV
jgi:hypothetical protein